MRLLGLGMVAVGFLVGTLASVVDPDRIELIWFVPAAVVAALGVGLARLAAHRQKSDTALVEANFRALDASLGRIAANVAQLDADKESIHVYDLPARIDALFLEDVATFVEARGSIAHVWGAQAYAEIMSSFAAGERYLNRVWSCAADGYIDEAHEYLGRSREQLAEALSRLESLREGGGGPGGEPTHGTPAAD